MFTATRPFAIGIILWLKRPLPVLISRVADPNIPRVVLGPLDTEDPPALRAGPFLPLGLASGLRWGRVSASGMGISMKHLVPSRMASLSCSTATRSLRTGRRRSLPVSPGTPR